MRILVVEDDFRVRETLRRAFREQTWAVDVAGTGEEAVEKGAISDYDVIVLDLMLPGIGGLEVCRRLRAARHRARILMLTARDAVEDRVHGFDAGADDYVPKPFSYKELLARVRALARRSASDSRPIIEVGPLRIDTERRLVSRDGRALPLTAKEYALIEYLASRQGHVVGRAELAEHVWDENFDPFSNTIEVHIGRLRRKIEPDGSSPLLITRRGEGYVLDAGKPTR